MISGKRHGQLVSLLALGLVTGFASTAAMAEDSITVTSYGGTYQEAESKAMFQPAAKELGITIKEDNLADGLPDVRLQVQGHAVKWDVVELSAEECVRGTQEGLFEKLDYSVIDPSGIDKKLVADNWIGVTFYAVVLAYNKSGKLGENGPKTWADFWDVTKFPGARTLGNYATESLTLAAMADGTPPDKVYPIDLDKAFKKLEEIKPHVTSWWSSGGQVMNLLKDDEVDMGSIWNGRANTLVKSGAPISYTVSGGVLNADCLVIPKGAKNVTLAQKAIAKFISPELQANLPKYSANGPANLKAFDTGKLTAEEAADVISSPQNIKKQVILDFNWWAPLLPDVQKRWQAFLQE
ncbi:MAG: ABC transporter substrate-binding protein [Rhodospirillaceae bacterium]|nr:MAG: ABC transporter substrate-binding protein [Rhodospirillaceae bacterium]